ncbi:7948_t:CDS:1, partial [Acaulospora morrowiae]
IEGNDQGDKKDRLGDSITPNNSSSTNNYETSKFKSIKRTFSWLINMIMDLRNVVTHKFKQSELEEIIGKSPTKTDYKNFYV